MTPIKGQWYEDLDADELFRVVLVDEENELVEVEYQNGEMEEFDFETFDELELRETRAPPNGA